MGPNHNPKVFKSSNSPLASIMAMEFCSRSYGLLQELDTLINLKVANLSKHMDPAMGECGTFPPNYSMSSGASTETYSISKS